MDDASARAILAFHPGGLRRLHGLAAPTNAASRTPQLRSTASMAGERCPMRTDAVPASYAVAW